MIGSATIMVNDKHADNLPISPDYLRGLIQKSYDAGECSNELADIVVRIISGFLDGKNCRFRYGDVVADDILSDATINALTALQNQKIDPSGNPFSYITRCAAHEYARHTVNASQRRTDWTRYANDPGRGQA